MSVYADAAERFRGLHAVGRTLVLPNAWDAASARLVEGAGAAAIATTSSGVAWANGYPDGDVIPPRVLVDAVTRIVRVVAIPVSVDAEGGYAEDPTRVAETVRALIDVGVVGVNLEDGSRAPDVLCAKVTAVREAAVRSGIDLFVNARTDVFLRGLVPPERRVAETLARAARYRDAGCDGLFVPAASDPEDIAALVAGTELPVNVMVMPGLPPIATLAALGVRRVSAGAAIAQAVHGLTRRLAARLLADGGDAGLFEGAVPYAELNGLFAATGS
ncbi:MAG: isocitrate lyase/phosphoenolpyruvate mutase family protein [Deltaproteobacteria bacterium]|nr:isocitrate lyase/phosphoenolpyruvate mutase family protein [Deltaproteobacteria bacterium]